MMSKAARAKLRASAKRKPAKKKKRKRKGVLSKVWTWIKGYSTSTKRHRRRVKKRV